MDKTEYKIRTDEIKALIQEGNFKQAAEIADTIDWRQINNVRTLGMISDIYKMVRRYEDSRAILLLAYDRMPNSRMILYALTELSVKLDDVVKAWNYYKEFCNIAPEDSRQYILLFRIYAAQDVSLEEQIKVLETLKAKDYTDRWAYELAYLYHRIGFATKCVEECDELFLWFGEGKYVRKALELKRLHEPLTEKQQYFYDGVAMSDPETDRTKVIPNLDKAMTPEMTQMDATEAPTTILPTAELNANIDEIQVQTVDVANQYNTMNLQAALAKNLEELMQAEQKDEAQQAPDGVQAALAGAQQALAGAQPVSVHTGQIHEIKSPTVRLTSAGDTQRFDIPEGTTVGDLLAAGSAQEEEEQLFRDESAFTEETPVSETEYEETPASETEYEETPVEETVYEEAPAQPIRGVVTGETQELEHIPDSEDVFFEDPATVDLTATARKIAEAETAKSAAARKIAEAEATYTTAGTQSSISKVIVPKNPGAGVFKVPQAMDPAEFANQSSDFDELISQDSDGQLAMAMPEQKVIEKQITGQLSIEDILANFEQLKKEKEEKLADSVKRRVLEQTGDILAEFDEASRDGLLEQLQKKSVQAEEAERLRVESRKQEAEAETGEQSDETAKLPIDEAQEFAEEVEEAAQELQESAADRILTVEEKELFDTYIQSRRARAQLIKALDLMSLAPFTGNVVVSGEPDAGTMDFAKNLVHHMKLTDHNFSGKAAKITGASLNKKDIGIILNKMKNGALIIEQAGGMNCSTCEKLVKQLQNEERGVLLILVDTRIAIDSLFQVNDVLHDPFNARVDIEALTDKALVAYGRKYAYEKEYAIDELGMLALNTRISRMQTLNHAVTVGEVRQIVKGAIDHANRKNFNHYCDILLGRRYDAEDMIILRENDFLLQP
ncbi:MAG: hypothetical protein K6G23_00150 [Lachnospiraceae bacterium]|nr:hypothetical protein [Lachnospiraceae bacterium]